MGNRHREELAELLWDMGRLLKDQLRQGDFGSQITFLQLKTLHFIREQAPSMKAVAGFLDITAPSATTLINNLVKEKYVARKESSLDHRSVTLSLTPKGRQALQRARRQITEKTTLLFESLAPAEVQQLKKILKKILDTHIAS